ERQVVIGADELDRIERPRLQGLERVAGGHVGDAGAELLPYLPAEAGRAEAQALKVGNARQLVAEPASGLGAGIAGKKSADAELIVDLVPDLLATEIADPGRQLARGHAERHPRDEAQSLTLVLPVVGRGMAHLGIAIDDGIERL